MIIVNGNNEAVKEKLKTINNLNNQDRLEKLRTNYKILLNRSSINYDNARKNLNQLRDGYNE